MQDQSSQQQLTFFTYAETLERMPFLEDLFASIEDSIIQYAYVRGVDESEVRRLVAGRVCREDLKEFEGSFQVMEKKETPLKDWNALVSIAKGKRRKFDAETIQTAQQLKRDLEGDDQARADELRAEVDLHKISMSEKKKEKEMEKMEKEVEKMEKKKETGEGQDVSYRLVQYNKDLVKLTNNLTYMYNNYGSHIILACANQDPNKQYAYPPFTKGNSTSAHLALDSIQGRLGCHLYYHLQHSFGMVNDIEAMVASKGKTDLVKIFRKIALDKWRKVNPNAGRKLEWKRLFNEEDPYGKINNWPTVPEYQPKYEKGTLNLRAYKDHLLRNLIIEISKEHIWFSVPNK